MTGDNVGQVWQAAAIQAQPDGGRGEVGRAPLSRRGFISGSLALAATGVGVSPRAYALSPAALTVVDARPADTLANAWGVCTHYHFQKATYGAEVALTDLLLDLGVRHIRELLAPGMAAQRYGYQRLAAGGTQVESVMGVRGDGNTLTKARDVVNRRLDEITGFYGGIAGGLFAALEGCNEPNNDGVAADIWVPQTRRLSRAIWEESRKRPQTARIPVVGPALARPIGAGASTIEADYASLGNMSPYTDFGNIHVYPNGNSPSDLLDQFIAGARQSYPDGERLHTTEGGYFNALNYTGGANPIPEDVSAKYAPRHVLEQVIRGNRRFFGYEFLDDPDPSNSDRPSNFGYVRTPSIDPSTWSVKPQFSAMKNFLRLFSDRGASFTPTGLPLSVSGTTADYRSLLVQKRSGEHYLCMWRDVDLYDWDVPTSTGTYLDVTAQTVTVQLGSTAQVTVYRPSTQADPIRTIAPSTSFTVKLGGELVVAQIN